MPSTPLALFATRFRRLARSDARNQAIDALRGLAIAMVILSHYPVLDAWWSGKPGKLFGREFSNIREGMGYYGVSVFFVISGFLITSGALRRWGALNKIDCSSFWWFRFSRIVPMLLVSLAAMIAFHFFG